jgi:hypothetical protein
MIPATFAVLPARRGTEVVVTGAPRKRVVRKGTWVRIPPSPPTSSTIDTASERRQPPPPKHAANRGGVPIGSAGVFGNRGLAPLRCPRQHLDFVPANFAILGAASGACPEYGSVEQLLQRRARSLSASRARFEGSLRQIPEVGADGRGFNRDGHHLLGVVVVWSLATRLSDSASWRGKMASMPYCESMNSSVTSASVLPLLRNRNAI